MHSDLDCCSYVVENPHGCHRIYHYHFDVSGHCETIVILEDRRNRLDCLMNWPEVDVASLIHRLLFHYNKTKSKNKSDSLNYLSIEKQKMLTRNCCFHRIHTLAWILIQVQLSLDD